MSPHLSISILAGKGPVDAKTLGVAAPLPSGHLAGERGLVGHPLVQALSGEDADLDFSHVQPTGVFGCVVKLHTAKQLARSLGTEHILKALAQMDVEVVQDQVNPVRRAVDTLQQVAGEGYEV